jgi:hypothetical protein
VSSTALVLVPSAGNAPAAVDPRLLRLKRMVLNSVIAANSKRNYAKALDHLFAFAAGRPLSRELMLEWRASMEKQSPSTINLRLSAMRSLVAEAKRTGMLSSADAEKLSDIPNIKQAGARKGNWLTREQAKELLAVGPLEVQRQARLCDLVSAGRVCFAKDRTGGARCRDDPAAGGTMGARRSRREGKTHPYRPHSHLGEAGS